MSFLSEDEVELLRRYQENGDLAARNSFIAKHLGLARMVARKFVREGGHLSYEDLVQAGFLGLLRAVETYDPEQSRFSTYAIQWVRQNIRREIDNSGSTVRIPIHSIARHRKLATAAGKFRAQHGRYPTSKELAEVAGVCPKDAEKFRDGLPRVTTSLNRRIGKDEETELGDLLQDERGPRPDAGLLARDRKRILDEVLAELPERERKALLLRTSDQDYTLQDIGDRIGGVNDAERQLTRERARQLIQNASRKAARRAEKLGYSAVDVF